MVLSKNGWLLTRQLARSITLHVGSVCCLSICPACCLPVLNDEESGGGSKREGVNSRGCLCSHFHGGDIILFYALTVASYIGFQSLFTFFYKFIHFNWRILLYNIVVVLPYIAMNQPRVYMCSPSWTPLPPPSPSHPSGSSQGTSPEHPVSRIKPGLAIHFTYANIHVSMSFSQIIPQSPKGCSICLCLFCCLAYTLLTFKGSLCEEHPT